MTNLERFDKFVEIASIPENAGMSWFLELYSFIEEQAPILREFIRTHEEKEKA